MGSGIILTASDGHRLGAYVSRPPDTPRGGVVVIQEAFGVNGYVRSVVDRLAAEGYLAIAPALYDRQVKKVELGYTAADIEAARKLRAGLSWNTVLKDVDAAVREVRAAGKVGIVGYCVGGSIAWLAAQTLSVAAMVSYYGRDIVGLLGRPPLCPCILHFAERDVHIPPADVEKIRDAFPDLPIYVYPGEHGFDCDARPSYEANSAQTAGQRTLALFRKYVG
jgi:carboxymethylenebutenolidase